MFKLNALSNFKQLEPQHLQGLDSGEIISQRPIAYAANAYGVTSVNVAGTIYFENGIICSLDNKGEIVNYVNGAAAYIHYDDELVTDDFDSKSAFAVEGANEETYIRLVRLHQGDEFVTDQVAGNVANYATVTNGVITFTANTFNASTNDMFYYEAKTAYDTTLPNGDTGYHFIYLG